MSLDIDIAQRLGSFMLEVKLDAPPGLVALFGPSGSGKTSLVNVIAGLARPDRGRIVLAGRTLVDTSSGIFVPAHRRRIGYVFQEGRLFPHLSVRGNLLYGRWFTPGPERRESFDRVVDLLGIGHLLDRRPSKLSGGEKQRVALGRALIADPRMLLMDEPLAALDEARKAEILPYIERLRDRANIPIVYVSHSLPEVLRLATTLVIMAEGRMVAAGPTGEVLLKGGMLPGIGASEAGALVDARVVSHDAAAGLTALMSKAGTWTVPLLDLPEGAALSMRVRARDVMIATAPPRGLSALNVMAGTIAALADAGDAMVDVRVDCRGETLLARLTGRSAARLGLAPGMPVHAVVKAVAFDRAVLAGPLSGGADLGAQSL